MGYVDLPFTAPGTTVFADVRGTQVPLTIYPLPFVPSRAKKG